MPKRIVDRLGRELTSLFPHLSASVLALGGHAQQRHLLRASASFAEEYVIGETRALTAGSNPEPNGLNGLTSCCDCV